MNLDEMKPGDMPKLPGFITRFSWLDAAVTAAIFALALGLTEWARWNAVAALALAFGAVFLGSFAARAVKDIWPRPVPPEMEDWAAKLEAVGWRRSRLHPWLCDEKEPHFHVIPPDGHGKVTVRGADPGSEHKP